MKKNWIIIIIISLLLLLITLVATYVVQQREVMKHIELMNSARPYPSHQNRNGLQGGQGMRFSRKGALDMPLGAASVTKDQFEDRLRTELGFSDEQLKQIIDYRTNYHQQMSELWNKMRDLQANFMISIGAETQDAKNIEQDIEKMTEIFKQQQMLKAEYFGQLKEISTPRQRQQLEELLHTPKHRNMLDSTGGHRFRNAMWKSKSEHFKSNH